ncbi:MAG TPA: hypothetical protein VM600_01910 [Actinomycetota bacterium]|nr:hypothetical protein [Actinomycetota bacterium]
MARAFFDTVADLLVGFLPPDKRAFHHQVTSRSCKVWYADERVHYEVQLIGRAPLRAAGFDLAEALEVGLHIEHSTAAQSEAFLGSIAAGSRWRRALGGDVVAGAFAGRKEHAARWRRISELWPGPGLDSDEAAVEAAERLARYISVLQPLIDAEPTRRV